MNATPTRPPRQRTRRPKPQRLIRLCIAPEGNSPGVLKIAVGKEVSDYFITRVPSEFGDGFRLEKIGLEQPDGQAYDVHLSDGGHACECLGYLRHGHCKHVDGLRKLRECGQL